jgi:hypothetical protein
MVESSSGRQQGRSRKDRRPRSERTPGVLVTPAIRFEDDVPAVQHGTRGMVVNWRIFSGLIVVALSVVLFMFVTADAFYVRTIAVSGLRYLSESDLFRWSQTADMHVFWIDPDEVSERLTSIPSIAEARVTIEWPPYMLRISVEEREPSLIWEQDGIEAWVDIHGNVLMSPPEERPDLLRIRTEGIEGAISINDKIDQAIVEGARQLRELIPSTQALRYHTVKGLGFRDTGGWDAWFGAGNNMRDKILIYEALVDDLSRRGVTVSEINVSNPHSPHYCEWLTGCG